MGRRVIVADDSKTVQKVIKIILAPAGYEIECFDNGNDALMAIKNSPPSIVLADVGMQQMDGYELGLIVKNEPRLRNIPVILMYGANYEINYEKFISSGARDKILKPFDAKTLSEIVRKNALKIVDAPNLGVINIDTPPASVKTAKPIPMPENWDMDSFTDPKIPDMKNPMNDVEENAALKKEFKDLELRNVELEDDSELSEEESNHLYNEYDMEEKHDGTIQFKKNDMESEEFVSPSLSADAINSPVELLTEPESSVNAENDVGLWNDRYYVETQQDPLIPDLKLDINGVVNDEFKLIEPVDPKKKRDHTMAGKIQTEKIPDSQIRENLFEITEPMVRKMIQDLLPGIAERIVREEMEKLLAED